MSNNSPTQLSMFPQDTSFTQLMSSPTKTMQNMHSMHTLHPNITNNYPQSAPGFQSGHGQVMPHGVSELFTRTDVMDKKLSDLDSIQSNVENIKTQLKSVERETKTLESKINEIEKSTISISKFFDVQKKFIDNLYM